MKAQNGSTWLTRFASLSGAALLAAALPALAQSTWNGGGTPVGTFSTAANWVGTVAPVTTGTTLSFDGNVQVNATNDLTLTSADNTINFNATADPFTLWGLTIRSGTVNNNSAFLQTINLALRLNGGRTINVGSAGVALGASPTSTGSGRTVTKTGSGALYARWNANANNISYTVSAGDMVFDNASGQATGLGSGIITVNTGNLRFNNAGNVSFTSATANSGTSVMLNNSGLVTTASGSAVTIAAGAFLTGSGNLSNVVVSGTIAPGTSGGSSGIDSMSFAILTLNAGSLVSLDLDRTLTQNADLLASSGPLTYAGTLTVNNLGTPLAAGDSFNLFDSGSSTGAFATTNLPSLDPSLAWNFDYSSGILSVVPAPEPTTVALFLLGLGAWAFCRRARR